jgi:hypothetical protein
MAITAARTLALITKYGVTATLRSYPSQSYDATTGLTTNGTATDTSVTIVPPYGPGAHMERYGPIAGDVAVDAQTVLSPSGLTLVPSIAMQIIWNSRTWVIVGINRINYKSGLVLYEFALTGRPAV